MVVLFNSIIHTRRRFKIVCSSTNGSDSTRGLAKILRMPVDIKACLWTQYLAICPAVENPTSFSLANKYSSKHSPLKIPYRHASAGKWDVVACISPLFYFERWQSLLLMLETYRHYGVGLQVYYVQSMVSTIYDLLKVYEQQKVVAIEPWRMLDVDDSSLGYDPNEELNWRNQPAAHTDCVINYKSAADFIIVGDLDDLLFPKAASTFHEEFSGLLSLSPHAAGFSYNRYNAEYDTNQSPEHFSLSALFASTYITNERVGPKAVVVPTRIQTMWLHHPIHIDEGYRMVEVPVATNMMVHFRKWRGVDRGFGWVRDTVSGPHEVHAIDSLISPHSMSLLRDGFRQLLSSTNSSNLFLGLQTERQYSAIIEKCYTEMFHKFYKRTKDIKKCPGPARCRIPPIANLACQMARKPEVHLHMGGDTFLHFYNASESLVRQENGCVM